MTTARQECKSTLTNEQIKHFYELCQKMEKLNKGEKQSLMVEMICLLLSLPTLELVELLNHCQSSKSKSIAFENLIKACHSGWSSKLTIILEKISAQSFADLIKKLNSATQADLIACCGLPLIDKSLPWLTFDKNFYNKLLYSLHLKAVNSQQWDLSVADYAHILTHCSADAVYNAFYFPKKKLTREVLKFFFKIANLELIDIWSGKIGFFCVGQTISPLIESKLIHSTLNENKELNSSDRNKTIHVLEEKYQWTSTPIKAVDISNLTLPLLKTSLPTIEELALHNHKANFELGAAVLEQIKDYLELLIADLEIQEQSTHEKQAMNDIYGLLGKWYHAEYFRTQDKKFLDLALNFWLKKSVDIKTHPDDALLIANELLDRDKLYLATRYFHIAALKNNPIAIDILKTAMYGQSEYKAEHKADTSQTSLSLFKPVENSAKMWDEKDEQCYFDYLARIKLKGARLR